MHRLITHRFEASSQPPFPNDATECNYRQRNETMFTTFGVFFWSTLWKAIARKRNVFNMKSAVATPTYSVEFMARTFLCTDNKS